ncbi:MAG: hypothetical protein NTY74_16925 [Ignavibacteriae bacterium]|nr:hypothetical protein [Ignavibacteriota bacterium]
MRKLILVTFILFFAFLASGYSQSLNLRLNSSFYTWKRLDAVPETLKSATYTTHLTGYQNMAFDLNFGKWTFSTSLQTDEDVINRNGRGFSYRFYDAFLKGSNLFNVLDLKLGRQYVSAGSGKGTIDGAHFKLKLGEKKEYQIIGYGGYLTPLAYDFDKEGYKKKLSENFLAGGQFLYYGIKDLYAGLSYANKNRAMEPYWTTRADSVFNPMDYYVQPESQANQSAGLDLTYRLAKRHNLYGKLYYDFNQKRIFKGEFNGSFALNDKIKLSVGYDYKEPQLSVNTVFWVFNYQKYQEIQGGLDYLTKFMGTNINIYGRFGGVIYDKDNSLKFQLGVSSSSYGLGITKYTGYSGESEGAFAYFNHDIVKSFLALTSSLNYSRYNLGNSNSDKVNVFGGTLGLTYRPVSRFSIDAQGQLMTNEIYKTDTRFLIGFNYWLFSNFN